MDECKRATAAGWGVKRRAIDRRAEEGGAIDAQARAVRIARLGYRGTRSLRRGYYITLRYVTLHDSDDIEARTRSRRRGHCITLYYITCHYIT